MKRRFSILVIFIFSLSSFVGLNTPMLTLAANSGCSTLTAGSGTTLHFTWNNPPGTPISMSASISAGMTAIFSGTFNVTMIPNGGGFGLNASPSGSETVSITGSTGQKAIITYCNMTLLTGNRVLLSLSFTDGRCNQEPWQSFAVYPDGKGGYYFYAIYQGVGYYALHVTEKDLDNNGDTGVDHVIAQSQGVQLWRLAGGSLQAHRLGMDGKDYSFNVTCGAMEDGD